MSTMGAGSRLKVFLGSRGASAWIAGALVATLGLPFLYAAALVGISARPWGGGDAIRSGESLDYARRLTELPPLREGFLRSVLGGVIGLGGGSLGSLTRDRDRTPLGSAGPERLVDRHLEDLSNDELTGARVIPSVPYTAHTETSRATRPASDPESCGSAGGTVWYRFRPATTMLLAAYTFGTDHGVDLGVFRQTADGSLVDPRCDRDAGGNAYVSFQGTAGTTYYFQIAAPVGGGRLVFSLDPHGTFTRATVTHAGGAPNGDVTTNGQPAISDDGRYVAIATYATNMMERPAPRCAADDPDHPPWTGCKHVYVRDTVRRTTELISRSPSGEFGDRGSDFPNLSSDGRFVVFVSGATNLGTGPAVGNLFVHDRNTGRTEAIPSGVCPDSCSASISDDGRFLAFQTSATFVPTDTNGTLDVYVYDRTEDRHELVSVDNDGRTHVHTGTCDCPGAGGGPGTLLFDSPDYLTPSISADGRYVVFRSEHPLVPEDRNERKADTYLRDRLLGRTERISVSHDGGDPDEGVFWWFTGQPTISDDGRYVVFASHASNIVPGDNDGFMDIFVRDRVAKRNILASAGFNSLGYSGQVPLWPSISGDGRHVAYESGFFLLLDGVGVTQDLAWETNDIYRYDSHTDTTRVITQTLDGEDSWGAFSRISGDGRSVVFISGDDGYDGDTACIDPPGGFHPTRCRNIFVYRAPR